MSELPAPLTPPGCTMAGNDWFPLHFRRLRVSKWWRRATDLARARNIMLWGEAYQAVPAGSLLDDDDELAEAAGFGFDVDAFLAHKAEIMAPWVLCSDGRYYHPTVCEMVLDAWERASDRKKKDAERKANQRARLRGQGDDVPEVTPKTQPVTRDMQEVTRDIANVPPEIATHTEQTEQTGQDRREASASLSSSDDEPVLKLVGEPTPAPTKPKRVYPPAFEAAWKAYPHHDGRSSKPNALANWRRLPADEQEGLVAAIERFRPNVERACGGKGAPDMARWLKDGKHLAWPTVRPGEAGAITPICRFSGPAALRQSVVEAADESFAVKFIDPAGWRDADRTLIVRNAYADVEVRRELRQWLAKMKVNVEVAGQAGEGRAA